MKELLLSEITAAFERAAARDKDWQARMCELAMLPVVQAAWRAANDGGELLVTRVNGIPHKGPAFDNPDKNGLRGEANRWTEVNGYTFTIGEYRRWNSVRSNWYSHSAATTWDGICRETKAKVIDLVNFAYGILVNGQKTTPHFDPTGELARDYGIAIVDDREATV